MTGVGGGGGGLRNKCLYREAPQRIVQLLQLFSYLLTIFHENGTPFVYLLLTNDTSFKYLV